MEPRIVAVATVCVALMLLPTAGALFRDEPGPPGLPIPTPPGPEDPDDPRDRTEPVRDLVFIDHRIASIPTFPDRPGCAAADVAEVTVLPDLEPVRPRLDRCPSAIATTTLPMAAHTRSMGVAPGRAPADGTPDAATAAMTSAVVPTAWTGEAAPPPAAAPAAAGLVALAAWALYRRLTRDRVLDNRLRRRVRDLIDERPGVTAAAIADDLDVHYDTVRHHLRVLGEFEEIREDRFGSTRRYFPNHGRYTGEDRAILAALRVEARRRILDTLAEAGSLPSGELADAVGVAPSTASHHLARLDEAGLVERERDGRSVRYELSREARAGLRRLS